MGLLNEEIKIMDLTFPEAIVTKRVQEIIIKKACKPELSFKLLILAIPEVGETISPRGWRGGGV